MCVCAMCISMYVRGRINAENEQVELNGPLTVKMKESDNEDWTES